MSIEGEERKRYILERLTYDGKIESKELVEKLKVSKETVRRYLEELEIEKKLKRVYGGAINIGVFNREPSLHTREDINKQEKIDIVKEAAKLVLDNEVIVIDEGTTTHHMIQYIINKKNLTILTTSFPIVNLLNSYANKGLFDGEVYFIGGKVNSVQLRTQGKFAEEMLKYFNIDKAFISLDGFDLDGGLSVYDIEKGNLSKLFIKKSRLNYILADSSKIGIKSPYNFAYLSEIDFIICDQKLDSKWQEVLFKNNVKMINASE